MSAAPRRSRRLAADVVVLDVGNSKTLGVLFCADCERFRWRVDYAATNPNWSHQSRHALAACRTLCAADTPVRVVSVAPRRADVVERQARRLGWRQVRRLSPRDAWPMQLEVRQPESLGMDRVANVAGMVALGLRDGLAIDAGTAITVDVLRKGRHAGGLILPGARLWAGALHAHTAQLPRVGWRADAAVLGRDTREALQAGLRHGLSGALRAIVGSLRAELGRRCPVLFTGGDGEVLHAASALRGARWEPDLLLLGVRSIGRGRR